MEAIAVARWLDAFAKTVGPGSYVALHFRVSDEPLLLVVYADGVMNSDTKFYIDAATWEELFEKAPRELEEAAARRRATIVRKLAALIISITDERGECTERDLRLADGVSENMVARYCDEAIAHANAMAGKGPFTVIRTAAANGAPA